MNNGNYRPAAKKGLKNRPVTPLGNVLPQVAQDLALDQKVREFAVLALWERLLDEGLRSRTRATRLTRKGGRHELWVQARDASTAGELSFCLDTYRQLINQFQPQTGLILSKIHVTIGGKF